MHWMLSRESRERLKQFLSGKVLLAFDFDGTLAPIVGDPAAARMRPATRRLLGRVAAARPCVVISGRSRSDLRSRVAETGVRSLIGNHGAEPWEHSAELRRQVAAWKAALSRRLPPFEGLWVEDKGLSLTVHYRHCPSKERARSAILRAARPLAHVRLVPGKYGISLVGRNAPDKGAAFAAEMKRRGAERALYVGDDDTDEDVFRLRNDGLLLTVRVGRCRRSHARYFLRSQREIDQLLRNLL